MHIERDLVVFGFSLVLLLLYSNTGQFKAPSDFFFPLAVTTVIGLQSRGRSLHSLMALDGDTEKREQTHYSLCQCRTGGKKKRGIIFIMKSITLSYALKLIRAQKKKKLLLHSSSALLKEKENQNKKTRPCFFVVCFIFHSLTS